MSKTIDLMVEKNTIKFSKALEDEWLPKMTKLTYEEDVLHEDGTVGRLKPRKATLQEKLKFCHVYAERQARLQKQIDWLKAEQERHRKVE